MPTITSDTGNVTLTPAATVNSATQRDSSGNTTFNGVIAENSIKNNGSTILKPTAKTATFTADAASTFYTVDTTSGSVTMNLPAASGNAGLLYGVKKTSGSNTLTVDPNSSELIDAAATLAATAIQAALWFYCDGTGWQTLSRQGTWS